MKIVKEGKKIFNHQVITCPKCEAILELPPTDLKAASKYGTYFYKCPCCGRRHSITEKDLNDDIKFGLGIIK